MKIKTLFVIACLMISSLACSVTLPIREVQTDAVQTYEFSEPTGTGSNPINVSVSMGAGKLIIDGNSSKLVEGKILYNVPEFKPDVVNKDGNLSIAQKEKWEGSVPVGKIVNEWNLHFGKTPMNLLIKAGAYEGKLDLGGIPLARLSISDGASTAKVNFGQVNPQKMSLFSYKTGASSVEMTGLSNTNASIMTFEGGTGSYSLSFDGKLQQDLDVTVSGGASDVTLTIPSGIPSRITITGGLNNVNLTGQWNVDGKTYKTDGTGPKITMNIDMGLGNLKLVRK